MVGGLGLLLPPLQPMLTFRVAGEVLLEQREQQRQGQLELLHVGADVVGEVQLTLTQMTRRQSHLALFLM